MVTRLDNWPMLYAAYLKERMSMPFKWGYNDCMAFVAKGVEAITGHDFFSEYCNYKSEAGAAKMLKKNGGAEGIIKACLGTDGFRNHLNAMRGDVVIAKFPEITGGLVDDSGTRAAFVTKDGLIRIPLNQCHRFWSY